MYWVVFLDYIKPQSGYPIIHQILPLTSTLFCDNLNAPSRTEVAVSHVSELLVAVYVSTSDAVNAASLLIASVRNKQQQS